MRIGVALARRGVWLVLGAAWLISACTPAPHPNIVVIVIDTLRVDRLGFYNSKRALTPFLDSLAGHGTVFWNAYAQSSWTSPSMASLWTSRYQSQHGITGFSSVLSEEERTLPKILKAQGYATGGFTANTLLSERLGFAQGFDRYETFADSAPPRGAMVQQKVRAEPVNREALAWLDSLAAASARRAPVFLYLQYMEPHTPCLPPKEAWDRVVSRRPNRKEEEQAFADMLFVHQDRWQRADAVTIAVVEDLYDGEVMSLDAQLRTFFGELDARGLLANAIVVITADHGEEIFDHGGRGHGTTLYDEVIHVPLLFLTAGHQRRVDVARVVSLVDVAPTLLELAAIPLPPSFEGHSQAAAVRPRGARKLQRHRLHRGEPNAAAYSELLKAAAENMSGTPKHTRSVVAGRRKLIVGRDGTESVFDLKADPGETNPAGLPAADRAALEQTLQRMSTGAQRNASHAASATLDDATLQRMRALGYAP